MGLTVALKASGHQDEALQLGVETLLIVRRVCGNMHLMTLQAMNILAGVHSEMGDRAAALPLQAAVLAVCRRVLGNDHSNTLTSMNNLAMTHPCMRNFTAALPLTQESLDGKRHTRGSDDESTIVSIANLAGVHSNMGNHDLALPLGREALEISRRVLGSQHPDAHRAAGNLGQLLVNMGDDAAAAPLLREAVRGLTAVYSAEHRHVSVFQGALDSLSTRTYGGGTGRGAGGGDDVPAHGEAPPPRVNAVACHVDGRNEIVEQRQRHAPEFRSSPYSGLPSIPVRNRHSLTQSHARLLAVETARRFSHAPPLVRHPSQRASPAQHHAPPAQHASSLPLSSQAIPQRSPWQSSYKWCRQTLIVDWSLQTGNYKLTPECL